MNILALESSATACSTALVRDGALVAQNFQNSGLTHSRTLLPMVDDMLRNCGESLDGVDVIAVAAGYLDIVMPVTAFFGLLVAVWYLLNELLSIIENAGRMGGPVPEWLRKYIAVLKEKIDSDYDPGDKTA